MAFGNEGLGGKALLTPTPTKTISGTNYVPTFDYNDQFLPEILKGEVQRFGDRRLMGILNKLSAETTFQSSEIKWTEQNRLHTLYNNISLATGSSNTFTVRTQDGNETADAINHNFRVGQTIFLEDGSGATEKGVITVVAAQTFTAVSYENANWALKRITDSTAANRVIKGYVYGSDFGKGTYGMYGSVEAVPTIYSAKPIIFKDHYKINGSDTGQIGWIEGVTEEGTTGYMWYHKSKSEAMLRWADYLELGLVEGVEAAAGSGAAGLDQKLDGTTLDQNIKSNANSVGGQGTAGLFAQIEARGHQFDAFFEGSVTQSDADIEEIILALEKQAAIADYMWFVNRQTDLNIDKWLATKNGPVTNVGGALASGAQAADTVFKGSNYGSFANGTKMIDLGFKGFDWGGYNFYKTDWRYLNDPTMRGSVGSLNGLMIPGGTTTVYDMAMGSNATRPFVYVAYRTSDIDDRRNKMWVTGSVAAATDDEDAMKCHFRSERALIVQAANNFVLLD